MKTVIRKDLILLFLGILTSATVLAQKPRKSPMMETTQKIGRIEAKIVYSSPSVRGREIWGELVPYDQIWRTGANEATTLELSQPGKIEGYDIAKGKYALFTIPGEEEWTIIINDEHKQWGAYKYDESKDVMRFTVKPQPNEMTESFDISIAKSGVVTLAWEKIKVEFKITK